MTTSVLFLTAGLIAVVHAAPAPPKQASSISPKELVAKTMAEGKNSICEGRAIELLSLPKAAPCKMIEFSGGQTSDGMSRSCRVLVSPADKAKSAKPLAMVWSSEMDDSTSKTSHFFKLTLNGNWEKSYTLRIQRDDAGKLIDSSAVYSYLDAGSPQGKDTLEHERDFWLKGMYRKTPKALKERR